MWIRKVINNNILCVVDKNGHEMIVTGRGLGFKRMPGESVNREKIEKIYHMEDRASQRRLRELLEQIPLEHLEFTAELIDYIKTQIPQPLNESLLVTLSDHISFAIQRKEQGLEFTNPLKDSIMCYYPAEYQLGLYCVKHLQERHSIHLSEDEASFIALHIVNAELNTNMSQMHDMTRLIEGILQVVEYYYQRRFDRGSLDFSRFVVHLRYFVQRIYQNQSLTDDGDEDDALFRKMIAKSNKRHYKCAGHIAEYVRNVCQIELSEEEMIYLTIHLRRINMEREGGDIED